MNGFIKISKYAGMREDLVQAGGGNSSFKEEVDRMFIKASGYQLSDVSEKSGYAIVNPQIIRNAFMAGGDAITEADSKQILKDALISGERPSIETFLHSVGGSYVLHTHPIVVNVFTCRANGMQELKSLFPEALVVPYATPGVELAKAFFAIYAQKQDNVIKESGKFIVFLQNHGLVISGNTAEDVISETERIVTTLEKTLNVDMQSYHDLSIIWENFFIDKILWKVTDENVNRVFKNLGTWHHAFCPDCVVYLGKKFLRLEEPVQKQQKAITDFIEENGDPVVIVYNKALYIIASSVKKALEIQSVLSFSAQVMELNSNHECVLLSDQEQNFLLGWDAEKYRRSMK